MKYLVLTDKRKRVFLLRLEFPPLLLNLLLGNIYEIRSEGTMLTSLNITYI